MPIDTSRPGSKPRVCLHEHLGLGLIIEYPTGVIYVNQTGGNVCLQAEAEGAFIPLRNDSGIDPPELFSPENELFDHFSDPKRIPPSDLNFGEEDADFVDSVLKKYRLDEALRVDRERMGWEAWVYVTVLGQDSMASPIFANFGPYPRGGVLTWCNSD